MFAFKYPFVLLLLAVLPFMLYWHFRKEKNRKGTLRFSDISLLTGIEGSYRILLRHVPAYLRCAAAALIVMGLARPQWGRSFDDVTVKGVDIMLVLDASGSMRAEDFKPRNRLEISKKVIADFIGKRKHDQIGLIVFSANAFTLCPLTTDYAMLLDYLKSVDFNTVGEDGTAIGTAIATAAARLKDSRARSRVIILLTDGANNRGEIDPATAAKIAGALSIKIYAVGAGKEGQVPYPVDHPFLGRTYQMIESDLDEGTLKAVAAETKGQFFRAQNSESLKRIYEHIDKLEKTEIKSRTYTSYNELFSIFVFPALFLLTLEVLLANTVFRRIP